MISSVGAVTVEYSNYTEDFVDNNTSDVDSFSDLGTHSTFDNEKASDSTYDTLTEENDGLPGFDLEDFVDAQTNIRSPTDIGTHSDWTELQDKDGTFDTLTEADTGGGGVDEYQYVGGLSTAETVWSTTGTSPYLDLQDEPTAYIDSTSNGAISSWYTFDSTTGTGSGFTVTFSIYHASTTDSYPEWELDWTNDGTADASGSFTSNGATWQWEATGTISGLDTDTEINDCRARFTQNKGAGGPNNVAIDAARLYITQAGGAVYDLDLEVGWTGADNNEVNEELCIFAGTLGSENIRVDIWDDVTTNDWVNVKTGLAAGWNNVSLNSGTDYLHDTTFEIRFTDDTGDAVEADTWQIEGVLLHTWTDGTDNYELDLEVQFTTISATQYGSTEEWLCIETGTQGAEALKVDIWYSSAWQSLSVDLDASTWNNISISSYLDSATATIRFKGGTETGDTTTQDTWQIDSVLIQTYSYACSQTISEVIDIFSSTTEAASVSVTNSEVIEISESESDSISAGVTINQVIDLGDSVTTIVNFVYTSNQVIPFSESVTTAVSYSFTINEVIEVISSVSTRIPGAPQQYIVTIYEIIDFSSGTSYDVTSSGGPITGTKYEVIINEIIPIGDRKHRRPSTIDLPTLVTIGAAASITILVIEYRTEVLRETYTVAKDWINDSKEKLTDPKPKIPKPKTKPDEKIKLDKKTKKPKVKPKPRTPKPKKIPKKKTPRTPKIDIKTIQKQSKPMQSKIVKTGKVKTSMVKSSKAQQQKTIKLGKDMEKIIKKGGKRPK